ncbi:MAG: ABC transporter permease [Proteobacteria bacterium]|nr:ABC transporter permease [Pseudomonadota bacterium]
MSKILTHEHLRQCDLVQTLVRRELSVKYRGSALGYLWSMVNPLLFMMVISFVFSHLVQGIPHYHLFILSGILFWNLTANSLLGGTLAIVNGGALLRKVKMHAWIFPLVPVLTFSINFALALIPYALIFVLTGPKTIPVLWQLPFVVALFLMFLYGVSLTLSSMNVFFRDVGHVMEPVLVILMYGSCILYDRNQPSVPDKIRRILEWNPLTHFVEAGRSSLFWSQPIDGREWLILLMLAALSLALGLLTYHFNRDRFIFSL